MTELDGATRMPEPNAYASDAGEFAARWNSMRPEMRETAVESIQANGETALRCLIEDHAGAMANLATSESVSQQITRLLGTDDWAILHSGHEMVTDVELDEIEAGR